MALRHTHFPYCLKRLEDGRYTILNHRYKPLGNQTTDFVIYEEDPTAASLRITATTAKKLSYKGDPNVETIYLYNDGCIPTSFAEHMSAYCKRLAALMAQKLKIS